jgi:hypothetical protein
MGIPAIIIGTLAWRRPVQRHKAINAIQQQLTRHRGKNIAPAPVMDAP